jgi:hypothetical protein
MKWHYLLFLHGGCSAPLALKRQVENIASFSFKLDTQQNSFYFAQVVRDFVPLFHQTFTARCVACAFLFSGTSSIPVPHVTDCSPLTSLQYLKYHFTSSSTSP